MSEAPRVWKYLERRPGSSYQQLCIKGKRIAFMVDFSLSFLDGAKRRMYCSDNTKPQRAKDHLLCDKLRRFPVWQEQFAPGPPETV